MLDKAQSQPWRGVGRINIATHNRRGMCTGTLIAPDIALTAAHCVTRRGTGAVFAARDVHFVAGWHKGRFSGHSKASAIYVHPDWLGVGPMNREALSSDLALIRLQTPIKITSAAPFAVGRPGLPGDTVTLISYRRDRAHALTRQSHCRYSAIDEALLVLGCAIVKGTSGAPVFSVTDGTPKVVAVISAKSQTGTPRAFAVHIDRVLETMLAALPE